MHSTDSIRIPRSLDKEGSHKNTCNLGCTWPGVLVYLLIIIFIIIIIVFISFIVIIVFIISRSPEDGEMQLIKNHVGRELRPSYT